MLHVHSTFVNIGAPPESRYIELPAVTDADVFWHIFMAKLIIYMINKKNK